MDIFVKAPGTHIIAGSSIPINFHYFLVYPYLQNKNKNVAIIVIIPIIVWSYHHC